MAWDKKTGDALGRTGSEKGEDLDMAARVEEARLRNGARQAIDMAQGELSKAPDSHPARLALALALMDLDDPQAARDQLSQYLGSILAERAASVADSVVAPTVEPQAEPPPSALSRELSASWAGDAAEPSADAGVAPVMPSENPGRGKRSKGTSGGEFPFGTTSSFATQTMAGLLDRQGDHRRADVIRESLDGGPLHEEEPHEAASPSPAPSSSPAPAPAAAPAARPRAEDEEAERIVQTLNVWLENIERERA